MFEGSDFSTSLSTLVSIWHFKYRHPVGIKCLGHFLSHGHLVSPLPRYFLWPKSQMTSLSPHPAVPFGPIWLDLSACGTDHPSGSSWQNSWVSSSWKTLLNSTHHWKSIHQMSNSPTFPKLKVGPCHSPSHFICEEANFQSIVGSSLCIFLFFFFSSPFLLLLLLVFLPLSPLILVLPLPLLSLFLFQLVFWFS